MFCNEIEETLFVPLPASLWRDYSHGRDSTDSFGSNGDGDGASEGADGMSSLHFRSLPNLRSDDFFVEGDLDDEHDNQDIDEDENDGFFVDGSNHPEFNQSTRSTSSGTMHVPASPGNPYSPKKVKSLFHKGCLFAYSAPEEQGSWNASSTQRRQPLSPISGGSRYITLDASSKSLPPHLFMPEDTEDASKSTTPTKYGSQNNFRHRL